MSKKKSINIILLIAGALLIAASFIIPEKKFSGLTIGIGAGLFGVSLSGLFINRYENKNPELVKRNEIELKDERNTMIRYRAKAMSGDITQWLIMAIAFATIIIEAPLWVTLSIVGVFVLQTILGFYFMYKYQKEM